MSESNEARRSSSSASPPGIRNPLNSPYLSPALKSLTAGTLFAEGMLTGRTMTASASMVSKAGLGYAQRSLGPVGMALYGNKFRKDPNLTYGAMFAGYSLFTAHGVSRMLEATKKHDKYTPRFGALASAFKSAVDPSYLGDFVANAAEATQKTVQSSLPSMLRSAFTHTNIARTQKSGAFMLGTSVAYSAFKSASSEDNH